MQPLNSSNSSSNSTVSTEYLIGSCILAACVIIGVPGNIAVITYLTGWLRGGSFTPRLMLSLAVSDLLTLLSLPFWIWALLHGWSFGLVMCKLLSYVIYFSLYCSILCVVLMSVQRYLQVLHPEKWNKLGQNGQKILLIGMWILSGVLSSYALVQRIVKPDREGRRQCSIRYNTSTSPTTNGMNSERVATLIWEITVFVIFFLALAYFYLQLYRGVSNSAFFESNSFTKLVTRIVACFFVLWIPLVICNIMIVTAFLYRNNSLLKSAESFDNIAAGLVLINSCMNPFLYAFSARALQKHRTGTESTLFPHDEQA